MVIKIRRTLRNNELRVRNNPWILITVTAEEKERIGYRTIHKAKSGIFIAKGVRHWRGINIVITGVVDLLKEAEEDLLDLNDGALIVRQQTPVPP